MGVVAKSNYALSTITRNNVLIPLRMNYNAIQYLLTETDGVLYKLSNDSNANIKIFDS